MGTKLTLLPHQEEALTFAATRKVLPILCDMGLGKTAISLSIAERKGLKKILCVVPKSVMDNWVRDVKNFTEYSCSLALGNRQKRLDAILSPVEIVLINFEGVRILEKDLEVICKDGYFDGLIVDELARVRRYSKQTQALQKLSKYFPVRMGLSGLLIAEGFMDVFNPFKILDLGLAFGKDFFAFRQKYFTECTSDSGILSYEPTDYAKKLIPALIKEYSFIRTADDVGILPPTTFVTRKVVLSAPQLTFLDTLHKEWEAIYPGKDASEQYNYTIQIIQKSLQCISGFSYLEDKTTFWFEFNPKLQELNAVVEELGKTPFIVWCNYLAEQALITKLLTKIGKKVCPPDIPDSFDSGDYDCFIGTYSRHAQGLNLKKAQTAILFSRPNSFEKYYQALGRNRRQNSTHKLISYQVITSKFPTEFLNDLALRKKQDLSNFLRSEGVSDLWGKTRSSH